MKKTTYRSFIFSGIGLLLIMGILFSQHLRNKTEASQKEHLEKHPSGETGECAFAASANSISSPEKRRPGQDNSYVSVTTAPSESPIAENIIADEAEPTDTRNTIAGNSELEVMTDYRSWTVIAADIEVLDDSCCMATGQVGVAFSNGTIFVASQALAHSIDDGSIDSIYIPGDTSAELPDSIISATGAELSQTEDGKLCMESDSITITDKN